MVKLHVLCLDGGGWSLERSHRRIHETQAGMD